MKDLNRRSWLKSAGLAGMGILLSNWDEKTSQIPNGRTISDPLLLPIRLGSNENPYGPSLKVRKAMQDAFDNCCRYPWSFHSKLIDKIAEKHGVSPDHIVLCAGSNEGLRASGLIYGGHDNEIIAATPTYLALLNYAEQFGTYVHKVPLDSELQHDLDAMSRRITKRTSMVFVCNPNNPTGTLIPAQRMRDFCDIVSDRTLVFSDEAYFDYVTTPGYPSMVELVKKDKTVIVSRTFSKIYGMAGIRAGYLITRPDIAARIRPVTMASLSVPAVFAALVAIEDESFFAFSRQKNEKAMQILYTLFDTMNLTYTKSHANFAFVHTGRNISQLQSQMRDNGVIIGRPFPPLTDWARVSTGTIEEMEIFAKVFKEVMDS